MRSQCKHGDRCNYAHSLDELKPRPQGWPHATCHRWEPGEALPSQDVIDLITSYAAGNPPYHDWYNEMCEVIGQQMETKEQPLPKAMPRPKRSLEQPLPEARLHPKRSLHSPEEPPAHRPMNSSALRAEALPYVPPEPKLHPMTSSALPAEQPEEPKHSSLAVVAQVVVSILGWEANTIPDLHEISMGKIVAMGLHDRDLPKRLR